MQCVITTIFNQLLATTLSHRIMITNTGGTTVMELKDATLVYCVLLLCVYDFCHCSHAQVS